MRSNTLSLNILAGNVIGLPQSFRQRNASFTPARGIIPELVHAEIELWRKAGELVEIDDYIRRYPSLADQPSLVRQRETCPETLPIDGEGTDPAVGPSRACRTKV